MLGFLVLQDVWRLESAKLALTHDGRIAQLTFSGVLTEDSLGALIGRAADVYGACTYGWVSDFTTAVLAVPPPDLARITLNTPAGHVLRRPGAFVAKGALAESLGEHVVTVTSAGIPREVFGNRRSAVGWVIGQVRPSQARRL